MKRSTMFFIGLAWICFASIMPLGGQAPAPKPQPEPQKKVDHGRGRKIIDPVAHKRLFEAHHTAERIAHLKRLPKATQAKFDCRAVPVTNGTVSWVPPVVDQGQCGSCWDFSGTCVCTCAFLKAMGQSAYPGPLSEQYTLDCGQNGGCNGDDNTTVCIWAKSTGLPTTAQYGPYQGSAGSCKVGTDTLYKITDWGYVTTGNNQSVAATQDIKNAMLAYGPIGCGVDASSSAWTSYTTGILSGSPSTNIDHDVVLVSWDDTLGPSGCFCVRNSWSNTWGNPCGGTEGGYAWIPYGDFGIGWEAIWVTVTAQPSPTPPGPTPVPPGPVPPVPPVPGAAPQINSALTANAVAGTPFTYQITATNNPDYLMADGLPAGLTCTVAGLVSGTPTTIGVSNVSLGVQNAAGVGSATLVLTVTATPTPTNPVTLTLTDDQVTSVIAQSDLADRVVALIRPSAKAAKAKVPTTKEPPLAPPNKELESRVQSLEKQLNDIGGGLNLLMHKLDKLDTYFGIDGKKEPAKDVPAPAKKVSINHGGTSNVSTLNDSVPEYRAVAFVSKPSDRSGAADFPAADAAAIRPTGQDRGAGRRVGSDQAGFGDYWTNSR